MQARWARTIAALLALAAAAAGGCGGSSARAPDGSVGPAGVAQVAAGQDHTCAVLTSGGVRCWGDNDRGQLGAEPDAFVCAAPPATDTLTGVTAVAAGDAHTARCSRPAASAAGG